MDALYRLGRATASEIMQEMSAAPGYSTVRTQLRVLEGKGHVKHEEHGLRYVYFPTVPRSAVRQSALKHLIDTFYDGSTEKVVAALLGVEGSKLSRVQLDHIADMVEKARKAGRK